MRHGLQIGLSGLLGALASTSCLGEPFTSCEQARACSDAGWAIDANGSLGSASSPNAAVSANSTPNSSTATNGAGLSPSTNAVGSGPLAPTAQPPAESSEATLDRSDAGSPPDEISPLTDTSASDAQTVLPEPSATTSDAPPAPPPTPARPMRPGLAAGQSTADSSATTTSSPVSAPTDSVDTSTPVATDTESTAGNAGPGPNGMAVLSYGDNLITNGDYADGEDYWRVERTSGDGSFSKTTSGGYLCVRGEGGSLTVSIGWPYVPQDAVALPSGPYQFSFRARSEGAGMTAKVGHVYEPYTGVFETDWDASSSWQEQAHAFRTTGDDAAGVVFDTHLDAGNVVCVDDVALRAAVAP